MKALITVIFLSLSSLASGQEEMVKKFERQETWQRSALLSSDGKIHFPGYLTDRGTFRMDFANSVIETPFILKVKNKNEWTKFCSKSPYIDNEAIPGVEFKIIENPFSKNFPYQFKTPTGGRVVSLWDAENAPTALEFRIKIIGNERRFSSAYLFESYSKYIKKTEDELNRQFRMQMEQYLANEEVSFDLSQMTGAACDMTLDLMNLVIEVSLKSEVHWILRHQWINRSDLENLFEDLKSQSLKDLEVYQAGIKIGQSFQKAGLKVDIFKNGRDYKLLDALFKTNKNTFSLRPRTELESKYYESAEVRIPKDWIEESIVEIKRSSFQLQERK